MPPYSTLATPSATRAVLESHGLSTKKSLGQHFLVNDAIVGKILDVADVQPGDCVLEVGPGIGTLTVALLAAGAQVVAIERDPSLPAVLAQTCDKWADQLTVLSMDALDVQCEHFASIPAVQSAEVARNLTCGAATATTDLPQTVFAPTKFIANLPYAVAATLVLDYFERFPTLEQATVMVQSEVADRMMAQPGTKDYGAYTVKLALHAQPAGRFKVGPGNFFPPPRVDSAVIRLNRVGGSTGSSAQISEIEHGVTRAQALVTNQSLDVLLASLTPEERAAAAIMADAAFVNRRKTLANSCKAYFATQPEILEALPRIFSEADIDPSVRGETLTITDFVTLGKFFLK